MSSVPAAQELISFLRRRPAPAAGAEDIRQRLEFAQLVTNLWRACHVSAPSGCLSSLLLSQLYHTRVAPLLRACGEDEDYFGDLLDLYGIKEYDACLYFLVLRKRLPLTLSVSGRPLYKPNQRTFHWFFPVRQTMCASHHPSTPSLDSRT